MRRAKPGGICCILPLRGIAVAWAETATQTRLDLLLANIVSIDLLRTGVSILDTNRGWSQSEESENACKVARWWWGGSCSASVTRAQVRAWTKQHHAHCSHVHKQHLHHMLVLREGCRVPITRKNEQTLSWSSKQMSYCHTIATSPCDPCSERQEAFCPRLSRQAGVRCTRSGSDGRGSESKNVDKCHKIVQDVVFPQVEHWPIPWIILPSSCLLVLNVSE